MHDRLPAASLPKPAPGLFWNPYVQIFLTVLMTAAAQILLKVGADLAQRGEIRSGAGWAGRTRLVVDVGRHYRFCGELWRLALCVAISAARPRLCADQWRPYFRPDRLVVFSRRSHRLAARQRHSDHHRGRSSARAIGGESGGKSMSLIAWALIIISQIALVAGQIFLKRAMSRREHGGEVRAAGSPRWSSASPP